MGLAGVRPSYVGFFLTQKRRGRQVFLPPVRLHLTRDHGEHRGDGLERGGVEVLFKPALANDLK